MPSRRSVPSMSKSARRILISVPVVLVLIGGRLELVPVRTSVHHKRQVDDIIAALSKLRREAKARNHHPRGSVRIDVRDRIRRRPCLTLGPAPEELAGVVERFPGVEPVGGLFDLSGIPAHRAPY